MNSRTKNTQKDEIFGKLYEIAKKSKRPLAELATYYAMERYLNRLSRSPYTDLFVLKGSFLFRAWKLPWVRQTNDLDLLVRIDQSPEQLMEMIKRVCRTPADLDGVEFETETVKLSNGLEAGRRGFRIGLGGKIGPNDLWVNLDLSLGDVVIPGTAQVLLPSMLDLPPTTLKGYSRESVVAEKYHLMVHRGTINHRLKDHFDVWALSRHLSFKGKVLAEAVRQTFQRRGMVLDSWESKMYGSGFKVGPLAVLEKFADEPGRSVQWRGFLKNHRLEGVPADLSAITRTIREFIDPIVQSVVNQTPFNQTWKPGGPWTD